MFILYSAQIEKYLLSKGRRRENLKCDGHRGGGGGNHTKKWDNAYRLGKKFRISGFNSVNPPIWNANSAQLCTIYIVASFIPIARKYNNVKTTSTDDNGRQFHLWTRYLGVTGQQRTSLLNIFINETRHSKTNARLLHTASKDASKGRGSPVLKRLLCPR